MADDLDDKGHSTGRTSVGQKFVVRLKVELVESRGNCEGDSTAG